MRMNGLLDVATVSLQIGAALRFSCGAHGSTLEVPLRGNASTPRTSKQFRS